MNIVWKRKEHLCLRLPLTLYVSDIWFQESRWHSDQKKARIDGYDEEATDRSETEKPSD